MSWFGVENNSLNMREICFKCGCHGHKMEQCGFGGSTDASEKSEASKKMDGKQNEGTTDNPFGPWMLPAYERRDNK